MSIIAIDLGTTNTKVTRFSKKLDVIASKSKAINYIKCDNFVEFDAKEYLADISEMLTSCAQQYQKDPIEEIIVTGQAETLVILDDKGEPLIPIISWLDKRSMEECKELNNKFQSICYQITGQPEFIPTWPATKILWIRKYRPEIFDKAAKYLLLKDYVIYFLTGQYTTDYTIAGFSCYFDIRKKSWWKELLSYLSISEKQLPSLIKPNTTVGYVKNDIPGINDSVRVNSGLLDHFAGMIGTGNTAKGVVSESAGTVLSLATFVDEPLMDAKIPTYCGPFDDTYVLLPVCESGGICLQWFRDEFIKDKSFKDIDQDILKRKNSNVPIFLPYIAGTNAPEFDKNAKGGFWGLTETTTSIDCALAIMRGVACMLKENMEYLEKNGIKTNRIISTGGGAKSQLWTQIKSDFTNKEILVPYNEEAPSLGAAILSSINCGYFKTLDEAISNTVKIKHSYKPRNAEEAEKTYVIYKAIYNNMKKTMDYDH